MRIISGEWGGRKIHPPKKMPYTRPTTDIAKEGLFNILQNRIDFNGIKTLDLFGGTGSISYELASRGATDLTIVEKDAAMHSFIKNSMEMFGAQNFKVVKSDVFSFLAFCSENFDLIFAGPPYSLPNINELPELIIKQKMLADNGYFILEHTPRNNYKDCKGFEFQRNYGTTIFSFFQNEKPAAQ